MRAHQTDVVAPSTDTSHGDVGGGEEAAGTGGKADKRQHWRRSPPPLSTFGLGVRPEPPRLSPWISSCYLFATSILLRPQPTPLLADVQPAAIQPMAQSSTLFPGVAVVTGAGGTGKYPTISAANGKNLRPHLAMTCRNRQRNCHRLCQSWLH